MAAFGKSGRSPCTIYLSINSPISQAEMTSFAGHPQTVLTETYIEALLVDEDLADQIWKAWDKGRIDDQVAWLGWWLITLAPVVAARIPK